MDTVDFKEVQRFGTGWAWAAVIAGNILFLVAFVQQVVFHKPFGPQPVADIVIIIGTGFMLLVLLFLFSIRLMTRITDKGICYRYFPFQFRETRIEWHELRDAYMRDYNALLEYGGWGIRVGTEKTGTAVNSSGSSTTGLQLQFRNGKLFLIGTRRPDEIQKIIAQVMAAGKINRGI